LANVLDETNCQTWKMNNIRLYGHAGGFQGYTTKIGMDPKNEIGIVVLTNAIDVEAELTNGMYHTVDYFLKNFETFKPVKKKISLKRYEGLFYSIWGDIEVVEIHGSLNFLYPESEKPMETLARLRYVTPTSFVMTSARGTDWIGEPMRFVFSKRGRIIKMYHGSIPCVPFRYFKVS